MEQITLYLGQIIAAFVIGGGFAWLVATSERFAAPRRSKPVEDRTLTDKLIIEADRRIDMINIQQLETFLASFVSAHLDKIIKRAPVVGPLVTAADYVDDALESFRRRNPDLAAQTQMTAKTMQEKLAGAIGQATKDRLTEALKDAGVPAVKP